MWQIFTHTRQEMSINSLPAWNFRTANLRLQSSPILVPSSSRLVSSRLVSSRLVSSRLVSSRPVPSGRVARGRVFPHGGDDRRQACAPAGGLCPAPNLHPTCTQPAPNLHPTCTQPAPALHPPCACGSARAGKRAESLCARSRRVFGHERLFGARGGVHGTLSRENGTFEGMCTGAGSGVLGFWARYGRDMGAMDGLGWALSNICSGEPESFLPNEEGADLGF